MALDDGVNAVFYVSIFTLICTSISLSIRYCYKSKCLEFSCCCLTLKRSVETEKEEDLKIPENIQINNI